MRKYFVYLTYPLQWGSDYPRLLLKWSKVVWSLNGLVFRPPFEYQTSIIMVVWILDYHLFTRHQNTRQVKVCYSVVSAIQMLVIQIPTVWGWPIFRSWLCHIGFDTIDLPDWLHWGVCNGASSSELPRWVGGLMPPKSFPDPLPLPRCAPPLWSKNFLFRLAKTWAAAGCICPAPLPPAPPDRCIALRNEKRSASLGLWMFGPTSSLSPWLSCCCCSGSSSLPELLPSRGADLDLVANTLVDILIGETNFFHLCTKLATSKFGELASIS